MESQTTAVAVTSVLGEHAQGLDHMAVAVKDLEESIVFYRDLMGFELKERRETQGEKTGMVSAVMQAGPITLVLIQGTSAESQVSRYVENYGPGIQHIAIGVKDLPALAKRLEEAGMEFDTTVIQGEGIRQIFTHRDPGSGMMYEFIERQTPEGHFSDASVQELFRQLEEKDAY